MRTFHRPFLSRRTFLAASGAAAAASVLRPWRARAGPSADFRLIAGAGRTHLVGAPYPETAVWSYNGTVPGPEIRLRQGERLRIAVENQLAEETTVHWHGVRVPNAMDGVPHLTQPPIGPGESSSTSSTSATPAPTGTTRISAASSRSAAASTGR